MNLQRVVLNLMTSTSVEPTTIKSLLLGVQEVGSQCLRPELHRVAVRRSESGLHLFVPLTPCPPRLACTIIARREVAA